MLSCADSDAEFQEMQQQDTLTFSDTLSGAMETLETILESHNWYLETIYQESLNKYWAAWNSDEPDEIPDSLNHQVLEYFFVVFYNFSDADCPDNSRGFYMIDDGLKTGRTDGRKRSRCFSDWFIVADSGGYYDTLTIVYADTPRYLIRQFQDRLIMRDLKYVEDSVDDNELVLHLTKN
jgi:hypothetical protein